MAFGVERDGAYGAVFIFDLQRAHVGGLELLQLLLSSRRREIIVGDLLEPLLLRELIGALAREEHVRALLHHRARNADRVLRCSNSGDRARRARPPVHDRRVELMCLVPGEDRAPSGIEIGIVLEHQHRRLDGVERIAAGRQDLRSGIERPVQRRPDRGVRFRSRPRRLDDAGAAVDHELPVLGLGGSRHQQSSDQGNVKRIRPLLHSPAQRTSLDSREAQGKPCPHTSLRRSRG
jgi:hypothetical protein